MDIVIRYHIMIHYLYAIDIIKLSPLFINLYVYVQFY